MAPERGDRKTSVAKNSGATATLPDKPPSLPASVAMAVADPPEVEVERDGRLVRVPGTWRPPQHRILPELLDEASRTISALLMPAGEAGVRRVITAMMFAGLRMPVTDGMDESTMQAFLAEQGATFQRHLKDIPYDILDKAADACVRDSPIFPAVADFFRHAKPELEKRRQQCERINRLRALKDSPKQEEAFVPEPEDVRLRGIVARYLKHRESFLGPGLAKNAIASERRLAEIEKREPAEWARDIVAAPQPVATTAPPLPPTPSQQRAGAVARAVMRTTAAAMEAAAAPEPWRDGQPLYQTREEEPPPPTEEPEGDYDAVVEP